MILAGGQPIASESGDVVCPGRIEVGECDDHIAGFRKNRQSSIHARRPTAVAELPYAVRLYNLFKSVRIFRSRPRCIHLPCRQEIGVMRISREPEISALTNFRRSPTVE